MFKAAKRTLMAAVVIAAASGPSVASAGVGAPTGVQVGTTGVGICHRHAGRCSSLAGVHANATHAHPAFPTAAASPDGFQWGDAGIGAAGMLLLLTAGGVAMTAGRRQHRRATTS